MFVARLVVKRRKKVNAVPTHGSSTSTAPGRRLMPWVMLLLALFDLVSDIGFVVFLGNHPALDELRIPYYLSIAFVALPMVSNLSALLYLLSLALETDAIFTAWLDENMCGTSLFLFLGAANVIALDIISSRMCGLKALCAPRFHSTIQHKIEFAGLITYFLEDFPQIAVQGYVALWLGGSLSRAQSISFLFTGGNVMVGILKRVLRFLWLMFGSSEAPLLELKDVGAEGIASDKAAPVVVEGTTAVVEGSTAVVEETA